MQMNVKNKLAVGFSNSITLSFHAQGIENDHRVLWYFGGSFYKILAYPTPFGLFIELFTKVLQCSSVGRHVISTSLLQKVMCFEKLHHLFAESANQILCQRGFSAAYTPGKNNDFSWHTVFPLIE